jgi:predicted porin
LPASGLIVVPAHVPINSDFRFPWSLASPLTKVPFFLTFQYGDIYMKKTLVALAVLAAAGSSFAQVTITGKLGFGAQRDPVNATAAAPTADPKQGLIMTDGNITFATSEDLGGGWKAGTSMELRVRGRDDNTAGGGWTRDARVTLTTPFGLITAGSYEAPSALLNAFAGAPVELSTNADGNAGSNTSVPLSARANIDAISLSAPIGPVVLTGLYGEAGRGTAGLAAAPTDVPQAGNQSGIAFALLAATYRAGPVVVAVDYTNYSAKKATIALTGVTIYNTADVQKFYDGLDRVRVWGTYDFGMAKVGLGYQNVTHNAADQFAAGVSVPMGAVTFGLTYASRNAITNAAVVPASVPASLVAGVANTSVPYILAGNATEKTFTGVGVQYSFSKMTNLNLSYGTHTGTANYSDEYRIRLLKNF